MILALLLMVAMPMMAERVSPETARKVATTFLNNNGAKAAQLTDLSKEAGFPNLYIFSGSPGFVVMAADDCVQPILGYSLTGKFMTEGMPENLKWWLHGYSGQIQEAIESKTKSSPSITKQWNDLIAGKSNSATSEVVVEPLIQTKWNQESPYNSYCPKGTVTGCVATAMAQVMKYWNYPTQGQGSHAYTPENHPEYGEQSANFGETTYDWANMTNTYGSSSTDIQKKAVATLMYHCGVAVDMNYGPSSEGGSGAYSEIVPSAWVNYFKYAQSASKISRDAYTDSQWIAFLKNELNESRPLYYSGSNTNSGHAFVCDGYRSDNYFHFNWGWGGYDGSYGSTHGNNGYWAIGALSPGSGGTGSGSGTYNLNNAVIAWAEPISELAAPTLSVSVAESGTYFILSWEAIDNANSYDIYRDNERIATGITDNSFTDSNISSGIYYDYYVRAVNSECRSNISNHVTIMTVFRDLRPTNLMATAEGNSINLEWNGYDDKESMELHYGVASNNMGYNAGEEAVAGTYWGQRYPAATLNSLCGMELNKVSVYLYYAGNYSCYIFNGSISDENKIHEISLTKDQNGMAWVDFEPNANLNIDHTKDLWIVFYYNNQNGTYPAVYGQYDGYDAQEAKYLSASLEDLSNNVCEDNISWLIKVYLSDGTYTYNLYDGTTQLASNLTETTYTHVSPAQNTAHQYTVKTNYYGGESSASNMAGLTLGSASLSDLQMADNDKMTVTEGSTLTVSGTLSNDDPENLVLENGAQLIHNSAEVKATVKKDIAKYNSDNDGWNFIASPVSEAISPSEGTGFFKTNAQVETYDLYFYDEPVHHWRNYKKNAFSIEHKKGYLYANGEVDGTTLQFAGTLTPSTNSVTIDNLSHSANTLNGFNLVGNPFACNANVDKDFYVVDNTIGKVILASDGGEIAPCAGVFVKATEQDATVTFTKATSRVEPSSSSFDIVVKRAAQPTRDGVSTGSTTLDRTRVRLGDAETMEKFSIGDGEGNVIYIPQNGQDLAVACANGESEMPLNFKAAENGTYTLSFEIENVELDYLHLIDNLTGDDVDLTATPNYTFEARTTDYASRFRLLFSNSEDAVGDNEAIAFVNNENIVVNEEGTLQIVDMTGRVLVSTDVARNVSTTGMTPGIYVLRLISGNSVRTQKIVIE